jgi:hypothetical protein
MLTLELEKDHQWSTLQEPRVSSSFPSSYLRLLSALDTGWQISSYALKPTWDQTGFIYQVIIQEPFSRHSEEIILPMSDFVDEILEHNGLIY